MASVLHFPRPAPAPDARIEAVLDALPAGVVVLDGDGVVSRHNRAALAWLGEPLNGKPWRIVVERAFEPCLQGSELRLRDGRYVTVATAPLGGQPGQVIMLNDTSEAHRLRERLDQARRLADMGRMAAALAHQVRTPLAAALLYGSHLRRPNLDVGKREQFTGRLLERLHHLEALVEDMLAFARGGQMRGEPFPARALVDGIARSLTDEAIANLQVADASTGLLLRGNPALLQSALQNLVNNALRAAGPAGRVSVDVGCARGAIEFSITDSGPGIPPERRERLFEPMQTGEPGGTGLGLAVARAIVRAHGGDLWLQSGEPGRTVFICRLPARAGGAEGEVTP